jgi:ribA/ribD-fused uncharacterized protein
VPEGNIINRDSPNKKHVTDATKNRESQQENCLSKIESMLADVLNLPDINPDIAYRLGKVSRTNPLSSRPILVRFAKLCDRNTVWSMRRNFQNTKIIVKEDLAPETEENRRILIPVLKGARQLEMSATLTRDTLIINKEKYTVNNLHKLPESLKPSNLATKSTDNEVFFWGEHAPLSNFNSQYPFHCDGKNFSCIEQLYSYKKAEHYKDEMAKIKILSTDNPLTHKRTNIVGFNTRDWSQVSSSIMKECLSPKAKTNPEWAQLLLNTGKKTLCEASPHDNYWGLGLGLNDTNLLKRDRWGKNKLGTLLMELRDSLKQ